MSPDEVARYALDWYADTVEWVSNTVDAIAVVGLVWVGVLTAATIYLTRRPL